MTHTDEAADWSAVRADYLARDLMIEQICAKHGVTQSQLMYRRQKEGWPSRRRGRSGGALLGRVVRLVERQVWLLERRAMTGDGPNDKDISQMNTLTRTLEKLIEIEEKTKRAEPAEPYPGENIDEMREALIKRMREIEGE